MLIKALENAVYEGKRYSVGAEYEVTAEIGYALGTSVEILDGRSTSPKTARKTLSKPRMNVKKAVMSNRQVRTKRK